jgi:hypothetical protein
MWINPKFKDQVEQPRPPAENGRRLATFPRGDGAEMRVNLSEYQGKPFVSLRLWERDQDGAWWPVKGKGCSVRMNEAGELAEVLAGVAAGQGVATNARPSARDDPPRYVNKNRPARAPLGPGTMPKLGGGGQDFDEFGGN